MMFEFSTFEVGLVKYWYDEQLAVIMASLVGSLVSENATLDTGTATRRVSRSSQGVAENSVLLCERCRRSSVECRLPEITGQFVTLHLHCFGVELDGSAW